MLKFHVVGKARSESESELFTGDTSKDNHSPGPVIRGVSQASYLVCGQVVFLFKMIPNTYISKDEARKLGEEVSSQVQTSPCSSSNIQVKIHDRQSSH